MVFLNLLYFAILTFYGVKFVTSSGREMTNPLDPDTRIALNGPETFWVLTFATGLLSLSGDLGLDISALRMAVVEVLCIVGLSIAQRRPVLSFPIVIYIVYLLWLFVGLTYAPSFNFGIRVILKYSYPLLICLFASAAVEDIEVWMKSALWARKVALISVIFAFVPFLGIIFPVFWYATARAINYISMMIFSLALFYYTDEKRKNLLYAVLFILPCFIWVFRTSIMGSLVAIMAFYFIRYRVRSLPIIFGIIISGILAVFFIPSLHDKMFQKGTNITLEMFQNGEVSMDNVNTNAREAMWETLENNFYEGHELIGAGTGSVQNFMYTHFVFGGLKVPHSDYIQMKCDNGLIGLVLFCAVAIFVFFHCFKVYWANKDDVKLQLSSLVAGASIIGVFVTLYSDNTVNYSMATLSMPFGFYGMMLGLLRKQKEQL